MTDRLWIAPEVAEALAGILPQAALLNGRAIDTPRAEIPPVDQGRLQIVRVTSGAPSFGFCHTASLVEYVPANDAFSVINSDVLARSINDRVVLEKDRYYYARRSGQRTDGGAIRDLYLVPDGSSLTLRKYICPDPAIPQDPNNPCTTTADCKSEICEKITNIVLVPQSCNNDLYGSDFTLQCGEGEEAGTARLGIRGETADVAFVWKVTCNKNTGELTVCIGHLQFRRGLFKGVDYRDGDSAPGDPCYHGSGYGG